MSRARLRTTVWNGNIEAEAGPAAIEGVDRGTVHGLCDPLRASATAAGWMQLTAARARGAQLWAEFGLRSWLDGLFEWSLRHPPTDGGGFAVASAVRVEFSTLAIEEQTGPVDRQHHVSIDLLCLHLYCPPKVCVQIRINHPARAFAVASRDRALRAQFIRAAAAGQCPGTAHPGRAAGVAGG